VVDNRRDLDGSINVSFRGSIFAKLPFPKCLRKYKLSPDIIVLSSAHSVRPGDQHVCTGLQSVNPFEEPKPRVSLYTAQEIATLQSRLEKQLGPEYISTRSGPSGQKVHYITAEKCIQLANEVFGFNGWSSEIKDVSVDFLDENPQTLRVNIGISVIIRVTLRDGTFHEDIGYGNIDNCKGKAGAFEKAKKEATTDALKRALKNFGNVLGNCIYDKDYLSKVTKLKVDKPRWDVANLHRHSDYVPPKEQQMEAQKGDEIEKRGAEGISMGELLTEKLLRKLTVQ
jgi:DNA repair and recombination protein RAD52